MNKKRIYILILAVIAFVVCILVNFRGFISLYLSNAATATEMIDNRPLLAELVILAIIVGVLFMKFKSPNKND